MTNCVILTEIRLNMFSQVHSHSVGMLLHFAPLDYNQTTINQTSLSDSDRRAFIFENHFNFN